MTCCKFLDVEVEPVDLAFLTESTVDEAVLPEDEPEDEPEATTAD